MGFVSSSTNDAASAPPHPNWFEIGTRQKFNHNCPSINWLLVPAHSGSSPQSFLSFFFSFSSCFCLFNALLTEIPLISKRNVPCKLPQWFSPYKTALTVLETSENTPFRHHGETLSASDHYPFHPRPDTVPNICLFSLVQHSWQWN